MEVRFVEDRILDQKFPQTYAWYGGWSSGQRVSWDDFFHRRTGRIPVIVRKSVLESDEAIVGVLAHEAYELNALEKEFATRETMSSVELARKVHDRSTGGVPRNLHEQAWDACNELVKRMREESKP